MIFDGNIPAYLQQTAIFCYCPARNRQRIG